MLTFQLNEIEAAQLRPGEDESLVEERNRLANAEALASLAQAFYLSKQEHAWLDAEIRTFITFVRARQLPDNNCNWTIGDDLDKFGGGIFSSCEEPSIRVDGLQHYINGVTAYLEYLAAME